MTITFINPTAECLVPVQNYSLSADLNGAATLGLVINQIVDCDVFMECIGEVLQSFRPGISINHYKTGKITFADEILIEQIAEECDAAVCAIGHCGSCTAGTVKDGIALAKRGCPAVSLVTELFWDQAAMLARSLGWPTSPRVMLPYPIWGLETSSMSSAAETSAPEILLKLETVGERAA